MCYYFNFFMLCVISKACKAVSDSVNWPHGYEWCQHILQRYCQLWINSILMMALFVPRLTLETVTVPFLPTSPWQQALNCNHNPPTADIKEQKKPFHAFTTGGYCVGMAQDVDFHCHECITCQKTKLPTPPHAPLINVPIGQPWEMIVVDIVEMPISSSYNRYLLVVQDHFTEWVEAIPLPDQTAVRIARGFIKLFSVYGYPQVLHSDQGCNFEIESTIMSQTLKAFGVKTSCSLHTTLKEMEWLNALTNHFCKFFEHILENMMSGNIFYLWFHMFTTCMAAHSSTRVWFL